jgi:hypothetical protein
MCAFWNVGKQAANMGLLTMSALTNQGLLKNVHEISQ